jgi:replication initiation and membrane attachment protein
MRVQNLLEFTEQHRFFTERNFSLGALDRKLLSLLYQPMVGAFAIGLYYELYHRLGEDETGCSPLELQRALFLGLGLEPNANGRQQLIREASRLEAVGLLQVFRHLNPLTDETVFEYALLKPLGASEFFASLHLTLLLRDKIGKQAVLDLRSKLLPEPPAELVRFVSREEITVPFYELFRIPAGPVDPDLEAGWLETAPAREPARPVARIRHADMLMRFPRGSANRRFVEQLGRAPESMAQINYLAYKYDLEVPEICRLLDEDGVFAADGSLQWEELNRRAHMVFRQDRKREEERERFIARGERRLSVDGLPVEADGGGSAMRGEPEASVPGLDVPERFAGMWSIERYNAMLQHEPYTRMLERYFPGTVPDSFARIFERIDLNYKLPEPVINVLIHYVFGMKHSQRLTQAYIDAIASNMLARGIDSYESAVMYVREQIKLNEMLQHRAKGGAEAAASSAKTRQQKPARRKPEMPVVEDTGPSRSITPEEREKMRALVRKLKDDK